MKTHIFQNGELVRIDEISPGSTTKYHLENIAQVEISQLKQELVDTDYIAIKAFEGEDVSKYGNWKGRRHAIRERINELEEQKAEWEAERQQEEINE